MYKKLGAKFLNEYDGKFSKVEKLILEAAYNSPDEFKITISKNGTVQTKIKR